MSISFEELALDPERCSLERRGEHVVLVRVRSRAVGGRRLPDAVFTFRAGDPQYAFWAAQLRARESSG
jgi:hypothetical protein